MNLEEASGAVARLERATLSWSGPRSAAEARELLVNLRTLETQLPPLQRSLEEARIQAANMGGALPNNLAAQLEDCTARCRALQAAIRERREQLTSSTQGIFNTDRDCFVSYIFITLVLLTLRQFLTNRTNCKCKRTIFT